MHDYVNAPRYLLRKFCVLRLIHGIPQTSKVLEIGCGAGDLCETLHHKGYSVSGIDFSTEAIAICRNRLARVPGAENLHFSEETIHNIKDKYDLILMLEVLEHIEDDHGMLDQIYQRLNPGGHLVLSVPAHKDKFGPSDRYVGHYRRYDKEDLMNILEEHMFNIQQIWSYGVPLANITDMIRNAVHAKRMGRGREEGTKQSGIDRNIESRFRFVLNDVCLFPFYWLQMPFFSTNMGSGFIVKAKKDNGSEIGQRMGGTAKA